MTIFLFSFSFKCNINTFKPKKMNENQNLCVVELNNSTTDENYKVFEITVDDETVSNVTEQSAKLIVEKLSKFLVP